MEDINNLLCRSSIDSIHYAVNYSPHLISPSLDTSIKVAAKNSLSTIGIPTSFYISPKIKNPWRRRSSHLVIATFLFKDVGIYLQND